MKIFDSKSIRENVCVICENVSDNGIVIKGELVCPTCEYEMVNSNPGEPKYDTYVDGIKKIY